MRSLHYGSSGVFAGGLAHAPALPQLPMPTAHVYASGSRSHSHSHSHSTCTSHSQQPAAMSIMSAPEQLQAIASLLADAAEECVDVDDADVDADAGQAGGAYSDDDAGDADLHGSDIDGMHGDDDYADSDADAAAAAIGALASARGADVAAFVVGRGGSGSGGGGNNGSGRQPARKGKMNAAERQKVRGGAACVVQHPGCSQNAMHTALPATTHRVTPRLANPTWPRARAGGRVCEARARS
jgi:hypothetical protein